MRFAVSFAAVAAMASAVIAQTPDFDIVFTPEANEVVKAGSTFDITWEAPPQYQEGTVTISLIGGESQELQIPLMDIAAGIPNAAETYAWTVDASLGAENVYGLVIKLEGTDIFQYSNPFTIKAKKGGNTGGSPDETTVYLTTSVGIKTITLTSCPPTTTTAVATTTSSTTTTSAKPTTKTTTKANTTTTTYTANTTTTYKPTTIWTTTSIVTPPPVASTTAAPPPPATPIPGAAVRVGAGYLALAGGLAAALLTL